MTQQVPAGGAATPRGSKGLKWLLILGGVVVLLGCLCCGGAGAAFLWMRQTTTHDAAKSAAARSDLAILGAALDLFENDTGRYPSTGEGLEALREKPPGLETWRGPYLEKMPRDPWGHAYVYECPGVGGSPFGLRSAGPNGIASDEDDVVSGRE